MPTRNVAPGTNVYFPGDPSVLGVILRDSTTSAGLTRPSTEELLNGDSSDTGLVPVRWRTNDGATYEHWENPAELVLVNPTTLTNPVPLDEDAAPRPALPPAQQGGVQTVRIKLGPERPAHVDDPLGRTMIGFREGLTTGELWNRGRGVWKFRPSHIVDTRRVLLTYDGTVRLVAAAEGITFHDDRVAILGTPMPQDAFVGQPDPLHNESRNPIAYGRF